MGMTFFEGNKKLTDGTEIKFPRLNLVPGHPVIKKDGTPLANGTYTGDDGKSFTVAGGVVGQINVVIPEPEPIVEPVVVPDPPVVVPEPEKPADPPELKLDPETIVVLPKPDETPVPPVDTPEPPKTPE
jgi:hypothetical protein